MFLILAKVLRLCLLATDCNAAAGAGAVSVRALGSAIFPLCSRDNACSPGSAWPSLQQGTSMWLPCCMQSASAGNMACNSLGLSTGEGSKAGIQPFGNVLPQEGRCRALMWMHAAAWAGRPRSPRPRAPARHRPCAGWRARGWRRRAARGARARAGRRGPAAAAAAARRARPAGRPDRGGGRARQGASDRQLRGLAARQHGDRRARDGGRAAGAGRGGGGGGAG
jgi:hypothetical protein